MKKALKILLYTDGIVLLAAAMMGPIYAVFSEKIGGDLLTASTTWAVFSLAAGVTIFFIGRFEDRIKEKELALVWGYLVMAFGFLGYIFVKNPASLFIIQIILGFGRALYTPAYDALYCKHLTVKKEASSWGTWEAVNFFTAAIGAFFGGLIVNFFGFDVLFVLMFILTLGCAVFIYFLPRKVL